MRALTAFWPNRDRYKYDFDLCPPAEGWAQVDTDQDAWYFGTWANPTALVIVQFLEGDENRTICESAEEFCAELRSMKLWNDEQGYGMAIDGMLREDLITAFQGLGLGDLLH
jgi:hypothetical protein